MKNVTLSTLFFIFVLSARSQEIEIPKGVTYKYATVKENKQAQVDIDAELQGDCKYSLYNGSSLIIWPVLWKRYVEVDSLKNIQVGRVTFHVPVLDKAGKPTGAQEVLGKLIQDKKDFRVLWNHIRNDFKGGTLTYRKLSPKEISYYWSIISFDIDEPLFVVEGGKYKLLVNFTKKDMKLFWIDEV